MTQQHDAIDDPHTDPRQDVPLQKDPRFWVATAAVGLFIAILYVFFASSTARAMIQVSDGSGTKTSEQEVHCQGLSGLGRDDWPLDDNGKRALTSVVGNDPIIQAACATERSTRTALILILAIPTVILGVRMTFPQTITPLHSSPVGD